MTTNRHDPKVRRHLGLFVASCSCGWSEETVSRFTGWMASKGHLQGRERLLVPETTSLRERIQKAQGQ
jgi:hypothetical protein